MRKADLVNKISEKTGIPKVDVLVTLETMFKEVKDTLAAGENIYVRGFGSFITKKELLKLEGTSRRTLLYTFLNIIFPLSNLLRNSLRKLKNW